MAQETPNVVISDQTAWRVTEAIWCVGGDRNPAHTTSLPAMAVDTLWSRWMNTLSRRIRAMTNVLLEELVLAVKANDADSFKGWLYEGLQELGEPVLTGLVLNVMLPSLSTSEKDRIVAWYLGVSL